MKKYFITGLVILLPVVVTIGIVIFVLDFLTKPFMGFVTPLLTKLGFQDINFYVVSPDQLIRFGSQIIILACLFFIILGLGFVARWIIFRYVIKLSDSILHHIPLVNKVYKTTQDIIKTLFSSDKDSFKQVVMVPFPHEGTYSLGLVSQESPKTCQDALGKDLLSIFVPTTPNPTTGFLLIYKKEDLIFLDMKTEDAIKYIVSCGVINPVVPEATVPDQLGEKA
jgi:uncharacterized membrane protein